MRRNGHIKTCSTVRLSHIKYWIKWVRTDAEELQGTEGSKSVLEDCDLSRPELRLVGFAQDYLLPRGLSIQEWLVISNLVN